MVKCCLRLFRDLSSFSLWSDGGHTGRTRLTQRTLVRQRTNYLTPSLCVHKKMINICKMITGVSCGCAACTPVTVRCRCTSSSLRKCWHQQQYLLSAVLDLRFIHVLVTAWLESTNTTVDRWQMNVCDEWQRCTMQHYFSEMYGNLEK